MKNRGWIIGAVIMLLAAVLVFLLRKKIFPGLYGTETDDTASGTGTASEFPLKSGSRGEKVKKLQAHINKMWGLTPVSRDYMPLAEDGIFGVKTEAACELFLNTKTVSETWYNQYVK